MIYHTAIVVVQIYPLRFTAVILCSLVQKTNYFYEVCSGDCSQQSKPYSNKIIKIQHKL